MCEGMGEIVGEIAGWLALLHRSACRPNQEDGGIDNASNQTKPRNNATI